MDLRSILGSGLAGKAADDSQLSKIYQRERIRKQSDEGEDLPPFDEWKKQFLAEQQQAKADADTQMEQGFDGVRGK